MPKIVNHDQQRDELLTGCFDLLSTRGYAAITMREIAEGLGVSTGSLYHYFPSKQSILEQMFVSMSRRNVAEASDLLCDEMSRPQKLDVFHRFWRQSLPFYQKLLLLAVDYHRNSAGDSSEVLTDFMKYYRAQLVAHLAVSEEQSAAITTLMLGIVCQTLLAPSTLAFDVMAAFLENAILRPTSDTKTGAAE